MNAPPVGSEHEARVLLSLGVARLGRSVVSSLVPDASGFMASVHGVQEDFDAGAESAHDAVLAALALARRAL